MPIKKSSLERRWYYRVVKTLFLALPFVIAILLIIYDQSQKNLIGVAAGVILYFLIINGIWRLFLYLVFGGLEDDTKSVNPTAQPIPARAGSKSIIIPLIILAGIFIAAVLFQMGYIKLPRINLNPGQLSHTYGASCTDNDGKTGLYGTNGVCYTCSVGTAAINPINNNCSNGINGVYCCSTAANDGNNNNNNKGCIPTGCGSLWHCSGGYYLEGQEVRVNGCYPINMHDVYPSTWTGICRQCP